MTRPISLTLVSLVAIVVGLYSLITKIFVVVSPEAYRLFLEFGEAETGQAGQT